MQIVPLCGHKQGINPTLPKTIFNRTQRPSLKLAVQKQNCKACDTIGLMRRRINHSNATNSVWVVVKHTPIQNSETIKFNGAQWPSCGPAPQTERSIPFMTLTSIGKCLSTKDFCLGCHNAHPSSTKKLSQPTITDDDN